MYKNIFIFYDITRFVLPLLGRSYIDYLCLYKYKFSSFIYLFYNLYLFYLDSKFYNFILLILLNDFY